MVNTKAIDTVRVTIEADGQVIFTSVAPRRTFSSGNSGYGAHARSMLPNGAAVQVGVNVVELKPKASK